jgi:tetratricopeptide (TPR) repeat protein
MIKRTILPVIVSLAWLATVAIAADGDRAAAEQWLLRAVESSKQIKTESAISHAADKMAHAHARLGQVDDAFQAAKRITNPQLKLYALAATIQAAVDADQSTDLMVAEARQTLKGNKGSFNDAAMKNLLHIAETRQKTSPATTKLPELPPLEQLQMVFDDAKTRPEKLAAFQPLMMRSLQAKSFDSLGRAIEESIKVIEKNPLPDQSSKFGTYGDSAEIGKIRIANLHIASKLVDEGKKDEAARHLLLADAVIDPLPENSALIKWELQSLRISVLLKLNRIDEALQHLNTIKTPLIVSRAAADIAAYQIENGQVETGLKTAGRIGSERGFGDDRGKVAIALFEHGNGTIAVQYINEVGETDEAMNVLNSLARHWVEAGDTVRLQSTFDSIKSPTAQTHYATSAAVFLTLRDVKSAEDKAK